MRRIVWALCAATLVACGGGSSGPSDDGGDGGGTNNPPPTPQPANITIVTAQHAHSQTSFDGEVVTVHLINDGGGRQIPYSLQTVWYKVKNPAYTQAEGRGELFHPSR